MWLILAGCVYIPEQSVLDRLMPDDTGPEDTGPDDSGPDDTGAVGAGWYQDLDGDGSGDPAQPSDADSPPEGYVDNAWDCADNDSTEPVWVATTGRDDAVGSINDPLSSVGSGILTALHCVRIRGGTYRENLTTGGKNLDIAGVEGSAATTIQGTEQKSVLSVVGAESVSLSGVTLTGGLGTLSSETLPYYVGGGINVNGSTLSLTDVVMTGNTATTGGGMNASNATVTLRSVQFDTNTAEYAGGVYVEGGTFRGDSVRIVGNTATMYGGAGALGGGLAVLSNLTVNADRAATGTDGLYVTSMDLTVTDATFVDLDVGLDVVGGTTSVTNGIFAEDVVTARFEEPLGFSMTYTDEFGYSGRVSDTGNIDMDPMFTNLIADGQWEKDDLGLLPGSPCIDSGDTALLDADGSRSDMGAAP